MLFVSQNNNYFSYSLYIKFTERYPLLNSNVVPIAITKQKENYERLSLCNYIWPYFKIFTMRFSTYWSISMAITINNDSLLALLQLIRCDIIKMRISTITKINWSDKFIPLSSSMFLPSILKLRYRKNRLNRTVLD